MDSIFGKGSRSEIFSPLNGLFLHERVKDYKLIVVNKFNSNVKKAIFIEEDIKTVLDLDGRKLTFLTDFRPRARYLYWTFVNATICTRWDHTDDENNIAVREVQKGTRYWGTQGRYVKENQLLGFVEELGHELQSSLELGLDGVGNEEPEFDGVAVVVTNAIHQAVESQKGKEEEEDEDEDGDEGEDDLNDSDDEGNGLLPSK